MAKHVWEIMNPELFSVEPQAPRLDTLEFLLMLGITGCPVIDEAGKVMGVVSARDLMGEEGGNVIRARIGEPAVTIARDATIEEAGRKLSAHHAHQLIVIDDKERAVGNVSAVDLVAAFVGAPVPHPVAFPHEDESGQLSWANPAELQSEAAEAVPNAPGVLVLIYASQGRVDVPVWAEAANNLRARIDDLLSVPQVDNPSLAYILARDHGKLHFRTATVQDPAIRDKAVARIQTVIRSRTRPR